MKKFVPYAAAAVLLIAVLLMVFRRNSANIGPPPERGYDYTRPNYDLVVHPGVTELEIATVDLTGDVTADSENRSAARDELVAVTGECTVGDTKVPQAFVRAELSTEGPDDRRLIHQDGQIAAKIVDGKMSYRIELRTPSDSARLRLRVSVIHFPWDFDPESSQLPDEFTTDVIADGEISVK